MYACLRFLVRTALRGFFRRIEVAGLENLPLDRGGLLVSWHPNALVDPALMLAFCPRPVVFGARHGLFRWPLLGFLLRSLGTVPIYRARDAAGDVEKRRERNRRSLDLLAGRIANGSFSALFPEGVSHDEPHLVELKTGAARLYYRARELARAGGRTPVIVPVGLHYDKKRLFRSRALVWFHPPIALDTALDVAPPAGESVEDGLLRARRLTERIERDLQEVVLATEDWETHHVLHRGRKLVRAERARRAGATLGRPALEELTLAFARVRTAYYTRLRSAPAAVRSLRERVEAYDRDLIALGLEDHDLDHNPRLISPWLAGVLLLQLLFLFLLLPPVLLVSYAVNGPAALIVLVLSKIASARKKDAATLKILLGAVLFPASWVAGGVLATIAHRELRELFPALPPTAPLTGLTVAVLAAVGALLSARYIHVTRLTLRSLRIRLTRLRRRRHLERLRRERAAIYDAVMALAKGLELPGRVAADGRIERN